MRKPYLAAFFGLLAVTMSVSADTHLQADLAAKLKAVMPDAKITSVKPGPIPGLYEVMLGATVLYMTQDGRFAVRGDIFDLRNKTNLTDVTRAVARVSAFAGQRSNVIEFAATNGKPQHTLYVFTDIDCGYCRKFHQQVTELNAAGISVRYLSFPRTGLNTESYRKAVSVWCSADPKAALTAAKAGQPLVNKTCDNPVAAQYELGQSIGVHGTPAVFSEDGEELGGYIPAPELIKMLKSGNI